MNTYFQQLSTEKQERIINAALFEFTQNGYLKTSTDVIVKRAGIGKGMLFRYFTNKKNLYLYLVDYCFKEIDVIFQKYQALTPKDNYLDFIELLSRLKLEFYLAQPNVFNFIYRLFLHSQEEMIEVKTKIMEVEDKRAVFAKELEHLLTNDSSNFRQDIKRENISNYINYIFNSFVESFYQSNKQLSNIDFSEVINDFSALLADLKLLFYTEKEK